MRDAGICGPIYRHIPIWDGPVPIHYLRFSLNYKCLTKAYTMISCRGRIEKDSVAWNETSRGCLFSTTWPRIGFINDSCLPWARGVLQRLDYFHSRFYWQNEEKTSNKMKCPMPLKTVRRFGNPLYGCKVTHCLVNIFLNVLLRMRCERRYFGISMFILNHISVSN